MEANRNYHQEYKEIVEILDKSGRKPSLFLHACCGPCLTYPLTELARHFKVTVGFINRNIYPESEYELREKELKRFVEEFNIENNLDIEVVTIPYEYDILFNYLEKYGPIKEGGERCSFCHYYRLDLAYQYADLHNYDYFTTVMTVSSRKPSSTINEIGITLNRQYPNTKYLVSDFKKENGQQKGVEIAKRHNLYRQNYCGCSYSYEERRQYDLRKKDESQ